MSPGADTPAPWAWTDEALRLPGFVQGVRGLVRTTQGLPLAGWETSCRFTARGARSDRLLLGFDLAGVASARLGGLVRELAMPAAFQDEFLGLLDQSAQLMLAVERQGDEVERRAYLVFRGGEAASSPGLAMRGFKWFAAADAASRITDYWRVPMAPGPLQALLDAAPGVPASARPTYAVLADALRLSMRRRPGAGRPELLVASEPGAPRVSCCLRLHEGGLQGRDLQALLDGLLAGWDWPAARRDSALQLLARRPIAWLAAGIDRFEQAFLTVYCEACRDDASHALVNGNLHATA